MRTDRHTFMGVYSGTPTLFWARLRSVCDQRRMNVTVLNLEGPSPEHPTAAFSRLPQWCQDATLTDARGCFANETANSWAPCPSASTHYPAHLTRQQWCYPFWKTRTMGSTCFAPCFLNSSSSNFNPQP